ncbi:unnamed protein product [Caenorhabditis angaria]|uniref:J domain-containing protein n=1 Tax=Caenorhabditis angaria TaxID=860376 RepID=A0A9P1N8H9_9PELO|nr:unnamed protein product [Caenorhabditis angaria]
MVIFAIMGFINFCLFITIGVREYVQQYPMIYSLCLMSPVISTIIIKSINGPILVKILSFLAHLTAIFLFFTSIGLSYDIELFYVFHFTTSLNCLYAFLYSIQPKYHLNPKEMAIFSIISSIINASFVQLFLSFYDFPWISAIIGSSAIFIYISYNIHFYTKKYLCMISCRRFASYIAKKNYYEIIGVPRTASKEEIKEAFVRKTKELHPDQSRNKKQKDSRLGWSNVSETEKFMQVKEAYDVLRNDEKRKAYDFAYSSEGGFLMEASRKTREMSSSARNRQRAEWSEGIIPDMGKRKSTSTVTAHFRNPEDEYNREKQKNRMLVFLGGTVITLVLLNILYVRKLHSDSLSNNNKEA